MLEHRLPAVTSVLSAGLAASCCMLPMVFIAAGLASAGLMMSMMRYEWLTLPLGIIGLAGAFVVYTRRRQQCATNGCRFVGQRLNQLFLILGTIVVVASLSARGLSVEGALISSIVSSSVYCTPGRGQPQRFVMCVGGRYGFFRHLLPEKEGVGAVDSRDRLVTQHEPHLY